MSFQPRQPEKSSRSSFPSQNVCLARAIVEYFIKLVKFFAALHFLFSFPINTAACLISRSGLATSDSEMQTMPSSSRSGALSAGAWQSSCTSHVVRADNRLKSLKTSCRAQLSVGSHALITRRDLAEESRVFCQQVFFPESSQQWMIDWLSA